MKEPLWQKTPTARLLVWMGQQAWAFPAPSQSDHHITGKAAYNFQFSKHASHLIQFQTEDLGDDSMVCSKIRPLASWLDSRLAIKI